MYIAMAEVPQVYTNTHTNFHCSPYTAFHGIPIVKPHPQVIHINAPEGLQENLHKQQNNAAASSPDSQPE